MADDQVFEVRVRESWMGFDEFVGYHWVDIMFQLFSQLPDKIIVFREQETGHMVLIFLEMLKDMGQVVLWGEVFSTLKEMVKELLTEFI